MELIHQHITRIIVFALFCIQFIGVNFASSNIKRADEEKWKKIYEIFNDRSTENPDSCVKAGKIWLQEIVAKGDLSWKSKALCIIGKCQYYAKDVAGAEESLQQSLVIQEEFNDQRVIGISNHYLALIRYDDSKYDEATPYFKKAIKALTLTDERWTQATSRFLFGYLLYYQKKEVESREQLTEAIALYEKHVDSKSLADTYKYLGELEYYVAAKYEDAVTAYKAAVLKYEAIGRDEDAAYYNSLVAELYYFYLNDNEQALEYYKKSYKYYETSTNKKQIAFISKKCGDVCNALQYYEDALVYLTKAAETNFELGNSITEGDCYQVIANIYYFSGNYPNALKYYRKSLATYEKGNSVSGQAGSYVGLGNVYQSREDYEKAFEMFTKSAELYESETPKNHSGLSSVYIGIGNYYYYKRDYDNALKYYLLSIESEDKGSTSSNDKSVALMNIANIYMVRDDDENTEKYLELAIKEAARTNNKLQQSGALRKRGYYYNRKKESQKALDDCSAALKRVEGLGLLPQEMDCYSCMYTAAYNLQLYQDAVGYYAGYIGARDSINNEKRNTEMNKRELQYEYEIKENKLKLEEERKQFALQEEIKRKQLFFDFESKQAKFRATTEKKEIAFREEMKRKQLAFKYKQKQDSTKLITAKNELNLKRSIEEEQIRNEDQKRLNNWLFSGLGLFSILMIVILKGYADKRKANKIIIKQKEETEHQKEVIELRGMQLEEKNKEIIDSINYARRLQEAILPPAKLVKQYLPNSFILYKPRDIVAGDFYWMESIQVAVGSSSGKIQPLHSATATLNQILFAAADCTGHGVPGAMVSVVCSGALNRSVKEFHLTKPGEILDKVRELVLETFEKSESQVKDGMDISLCLLDLKNNEVHWAGANNPLWIFRHRTSDIRHQTEQEIIELKPDKQPIGASENPKPFTTHSVKLHKGDTLYMSTDGYADQFGGEKGKKFKDSNMKKFLLEISHEPMEIQSKLLDDQIESWKGSLEQVDDICVVGVRV